MMFCKMWKFGHYEHISVLMESICTWVQDPLMVKSLRMWYLSSILDPSPEGALSSSTAAQFLKPRSSFCLCDRQQRIRSSLNPQRLAGSSLSDSWCRFKIRGLRALDASSDVLSLTLFMRPVTQQSSFYFLVNITSPAFPFHCRLFS